MKLEEQVCSLELSQKLKDLGIKQKSLYFWQTWHECNDTAGSIEWELTDSPHIHPRSEVYSAFTVAELNLLLPDRFVTYRENERYRGAWPCSRRDLLGKLYADSDTEADARAKMVIYLIVNDVKNIEKDNIHKIY
jgi:hypothetical protein